MYRPAVLIVDDDIDTCTILEKALTGLTARFVVVTNGEDAVLESSRQDFAVVIMDCRMPGMDGFDAAEIINRQKHNTIIPIIFLTGVALSHADIKRGYACGAVDYIIKTDDFDFEILRSKVAVFVEINEHYKKIVKVTNQLEERLTYLENLVHTKLI
jgi:CheY-like chemotaxis protein